MDTAIAEFEGTALFVSHDRYFLNKIADKVYELDENGITLYKGNYDDYIHQISSIQSKPAEQKNSSGALDYESAKKLQSTIRSYEKKIIASEETIALLEDKIEKLDEELALCGSDFEKAKALFEDKNQLENELSTAYELWNEYTEKLEEIKN